MSGVHALLSANYDRRDQSTATIHVQTIEARGLINADLIGKMDCYVKLKVNDTQIKHKSAVHKDGHTTPVWKEWFEFPLKGLDPDTAKVTIKVMDQDMITDNTLGTCRINLFDYLHKQETDVWISLAAESGDKYAGEIHLQIKCTDPVWDAEQAKLAKEKAEAEHAAMEAKVAAAVKAAEDRLNAEAQAKLSQLQAEAELQRVAAAKMAESLANAQKVRDIELAAAAARQESKRVANLEEAERLKKAEEENAKLAQELAQMKLKLKSEQHAYANSDVSPELLVFSQRTGLPLKAVCPDHECELQLTTYVYQGQIQCDVCGKLGNTNVGVYHCELCKFDCHIRCVRGTR